MANIVHILGETQVPMCGGTPGKRDVSFQGVRSVSGIKRLQGWCKQNTWGEIMTLCPTCVSLRSKLFKKRHVPL